MGLCQTRDQQDGEEPTFQGVQPLDTPLLKEEGVSPNRSRAGSAAEGLIPVLHNPPPENAVVTVAQSPEGGGSPTPFVDENQDPKLTVVSLDLTAFSKQQAWDETDLEERRKRDKLKKYNQEMSHIYDHIYVSGESVTASKELLDNNNIGYVINCAGKTVPNSFPGEMTYYTMELDDAITEEISHLFVPVSLLLQHVAEAKLPDNLTDVHPSDWCTYSPPTATTSAAKSNVLVHCSQGVSRSCTIAMAHYMLTHDCEADTALTIFRKKRGIARPNEGFMAQLRLWQALVLGEEKLVCFINEGNLAKLVHAIDLAGQNMSERQIIVVTSTKHVVVYHPNDQDLSRAMKLVLEFIQWRLSVDEAAVVSDYEHFLKQAGLSQSANLSLSVPKLQATASVKDVSPLKPRNNAPERKSAPTAPSTHLSEPLMTRRSKVDDRVEHTLDFSSSDEDDDGPKLDLDVWRVNCWEVSSVGEYDAEGLGSFGWDDLWEERAFVLWRRALHPEQTEAHDDLALSKVFVWLGGSVDRDALCDGGEKGMNDDELAARITQEFFANETVQTISTEPERTQAIAECQIEGQESEEFEACVGASW